MSSCPARKLPWRWWSAGFALTAAAALAASDAGGQLLKSVVGGPRQPLSQEQSVSRTSPATNRCDPVITSPPLDSLHKLWLGSGDSLVVHFFGRADRCPSATVSYYLGESFLGTTVTNASGAWDYSVTVPSGVSVFSARMTSAAGITTSAEGIVDADPSRPVIVLASPHPSDWDQIRIVAPRADGGCGSGGNPHAERGEPGWLHDESCAPGGQVGLDLTIRGGCVAGADGGPDGGCIPLDGGACAPCVPGRLLVRYGDAGLIDYAIHTSPLHLTSADLGTVTLPDWTSDDLVIRVESATGWDERSLSTRVAVTSPPPLTGPDGGAVVLKTIHTRHADVDMEFRLPEVLPHVGAAHIEVGWTTNTRLGREADGGTLAPVVTSVPVGASPTLMPASRAARRGDLSVGIAARPDAGSGNATDAGPSIWCAQDQTPFGGTEVATGASKHWPAGGSTLNSCSLPATAQVYCVSAGPTVTATVTEGTCAPVNYDTFEQPQYFDRQIACSMNDASAVPQVWRCGGQDFAPGDSYTVHFKWIPPLNVFFFVSKVVW